MLSSACILLLMYLYLMLKFRWIKRKGFLRFIPSVSQLWFKLWGNVLVWPIPGPHPASSLSCSSIIWVLKETVLFVTWRCCLISLWAPSHFGLHCCCQFIWPLLWYNWTTEEEIRQSCPRAMWIKIRLHHISVMRLLVQYQCTRWCWILGNIYCTSFYFFPLGPADWRQFLRREL